MYQEKGIPGLDNSMNRDIDMGLHGSLCVFLQMVEEREKRWGQRGRVQAKYAAADTLNLITTEDCPYGLESILDGEAQVTVCYCKVWSQGLISNWEL